MEMKLNIYNKREIVKTYRAETYDIMFGTVEDLINLLDLENINLEDDSSLIKAAGKVVIGGLDIIKPLLKDVFEGLTDEELRNTRVSEMATVLLNVVKFAVSEMSKDVKGKN